MLSSYIYDKVYLIKINGGLYVKKTKYTMDN